MLRDKFYRDPIHDLISLDKQSREDRTLMALIDAPHMQRLRRIRQLGLASLAYQGAEHSRFTHSLGAMHIATRILNHLARDFEISPRLAFATRCAALLHDVGHGPLSHVFERFLKVDHETWTRRIILSPETAVNRTLAAYHPSLPQEVAEIIEGRSQPRFYSQIISSQLDADRFDYLLRDSTMTGVKYGIFDFERLVRVLRLDAAHQNVVVASNGIQAVEKYLQARYHMYSQVYLHKTVRAGEGVFSKLLLRAADLAAQGPVPGLAPDDQMFRLLQMQSDVDLDTYSQIDDSGLYTALNKWSRCEDAVLADLARRILGRQLFKTIDVTRVEDLDQKVKTAEALLREHGLDPRYYFCIDKSGDTPYRPYDGSRPGAQYHILVEPPAGHRSATPRDIHELSQVVRGLAQAAFTTQRAMFPAETLAAAPTDLRGAMAQIFGTHLADYDTHTSDDFFYSETNL